MRSYSLNSPEAMARVVALAMLVDGGLDKSELDVVHRYGIVERLGLNEEQFEKIVHHLCEDMLQCVGEAHYGQIEIANPAIDGILAEIQDPQLRKQLLRIMLAIVDADNRLSDGEAVLIARALECWTLDLVAVSRLPVAGSLSPSGEQSNFEQAHAHHRGHMAASSNSILATHY